MKKVFKLIDLDCANCAAKMENAIAQMDGVQKVTVSFLGDSVRVVARRIGVEVSMWAIMSETATLSSGAASIMAACAPA